MKRNKLLRWNQIQLLLTIIFLILLSVSLVTAQKTTPQLFENISPPPDSDSHGETTVIRNRYVQVNTNVLHDLDIGDTLPLPLLKKAEYEWVVSSISPGPSGSTVWTGNIKGIPSGQVLFLLNEDGLMGSINTGNQVFRVRFLGDELHVIEELDHAAYPVELPPLTPSISLGVPASFPEKRDPAVDDGSQIDVMILYTPAARATAGGTAQIEALILLAVAETNQSFQNSNVTPLINLVHTEEVSYAESGNFSTDLSRLRGMSDGYMDTIHALRDTYYADQVSLIVEGTQYCGIGYFMGTASPSFASSAFTVVARTCATGYYSYGHELGHNIGLQHDWYVDNNTYQYTYSHGYLNVSGRWRTIMSYNSECSVSGVNCTRVQYFSNPNVTYNGNPMGVLEGSSTNCVTGDLGHPPCDAENYRVLNNNAYTVANFRTSPGTPAPTPTPGGPTPTPTLTPTATPIPSGSVEVTDAWTADASENPKTTFVQGETMRFYAPVVNNTGSSQDITLRFTSVGSCGTLFDNSYNVSTSSGTATWVLPYTLPSDACVGAYTYTAYVTWNGNTSSANTTFQIQSNGTPTLTPTPYPTSTPLPTLTPTPYPTSTPLPTRTPTPVPTSTSSSPLPTYTPAPSASVAVTDAWTADASGNSKTTFVQGETMRFYAPVVNNTGSSQDITLRFISVGSCGTLFDNSYNVSTSSGTATWVQTYTLPSDACVGAYTYTAYVTWNGNTSSANTTFQIQSNGTPTLTPTSTSSPPLPTYTPTPTSYPTSTPLPTHTPTHTPYPTLTPLPPSIFFTYLPLIRKDIPPTPTPSPTPTATATYGFAEQVVVLVNQKRQNAGCGAVTMDNRLRTAAQGHSEDMAYHDFFSHTGSNGSTPWDRITMQGYNFSTAGENIAAGYATPEDVINGWMNSAGHRANILNCSFVDIGVGYIYLANDTGNTNYHHYWTQVFAAP